MALTLLGWAGSLCLMYTYLRVAFNRKVIGHFCGINVVVGGWDGTSYRFLGINAVACLLLTAASLAKGAMAPTVINLAFLLISLISMARPLVWVINRLVDYKYVACAVIFGLFALLYNLFFVSSEPLTLKLALDHAGTFAAFLFLAAYFLFSAGQIEKAPFIKTNIVGQILYCPILAMTGLWSIMFLQLFGMTMGLVALHEQGQSEDEELPQAVKN
ncbi:hypothetical protein [Neptuniibacter sp. QD37_11]|uniref:hypothetical protein n=1 Tax=Neptuniibacter sp. QD37_11 TaxID=3398209 RepID=UPI0039F5D46F